MSQLSDDLVPHKKPRLDSSLGFNPRVRMNNAITLIYHNALSETFISTPTYTHQLYDEEYLELIEDCSRDYIQIQVHIRLIDLSHHAFILDTRFESLNERIINGLKKGIPDDTIVKIVKDFPTNFKFPLLTILPFPLGKEIHQFSIKEQQYRIYLSNYQITGSDQLLSRAEKIAMWYIETADSVDFSDLRWEVTWLYREITINNIISFDLMGYMTLFTFQNPFLGNKMRICQALIFPFSQQCGLGNELLLSIYRFANNREDVVETTVEDPSEGYSKLRNRVDFQWYLEHIVDFQNNSMKTIANENNANKEIATLLKIIPAQTLFLLEFNKYLQLIQQIYQSTLSLDELHDTIQSLDSFKDFRLLVKQNIVKQQKDIKTLPREEKVALLNELFDERFVLYREVLSVAQRFELLDPEHEKGKIVSSFHVV